MLTEREVMRPMYNPRKQKTLRIKYLGKKDNTVNFFKRNEHQAQAMRKFDQFIVLTINL